MEKPVEELIEPKEIQAQTSSMDEKDNQVKELDKQLREAHLVIAQQQKENRQLKKTILGKTNEPNEDLPMV